MRTLVALFAVLLFLEHNVFAKACTDYEEAYDLARYVMQQDQVSSYREAYDLINNLIDSATNYLAYCKKQIPSAQQYQLQQQIRRAAKKRAAYFKGAVREYHAIYGIRPNVQEVYQSGGGHFSGTRPSNYRSPPRMPPVRQPQMPSVR